MRASELRERSDAELHAQLEESHRELFNLRFQLATRQLSNYRRLPQVRADIARINTLLRERQIAALYAEATAAADVAETAE